MSGAGGNFDAGGQLTDAALRERLRAYVEAFVGFITIQGVAPGKT